MPEQHTTAKVVKQSRPNDRLRILHVDCPAELEYKAGQFTKIGLDIGEDKPLMRAYSFVNTPDERQFEFFYDVLDEGGNLTPRLDALQAGDELLVSTRPNGLLVLDELPPKPNLLLVSTGTGIGPFVAILKTEQPWGQFAKVALCNSVRVGEEHVYGQQLAGIAAARGEQFVNVLAVTREKFTDSLGCRVTEALENGQLEERLGFAIDTDCQVMMCGNPQMIMRMLELLGERGLERNRRSRPGNVTIEKYW